jgi:hypothetical protein
MLMLSPLRAHTRYTEPAPLPLAPSPLTGHSIHYGGGGGGSGGGSGGLASSQAIVPSWCAGQRGVGGNVYASAAGPLHGAHLFTHGGGGGYSGSGGYGGGYGGGGSGGVDARERGAAAPMDYGTAAAAAVDGGRGLKRSRAEQRWDAKLSGDSPPSWMHAGAHVPWL